MSSVCFTDIFKWAFVLSEFYPLGQIRIEKPPSAVLIIFMPINARMPTDSERAQPEEVSNVHAFIMLSQRKALVHMGLKSRDSEEAWKTLLEYASIERCLLEWMGGGAILGHGIEFYGIHATGRLTEKHAITRHAWSDWLNRIT